MLKVTFLVTNFPWRAIEPHSGLKSDVFGDGFFPIVRIRQNSAIYQRMVENAPHQIINFLTVSPERDTKLAHRAPISTKLCMHIAMASSIILKHTRPHETNI